MAVDDHGIEALRKAAEQVTPGDKSDYYLKTEPLTTAFYQIIDEKSSVLKYYGFTQNAGSSAAADTSAAIWRIGRLVISGGVSTIIWANGGTFDQIWDDRETIFPEVVLDNGASLLFDGVNDFIGFGDNYNFTVAQQFSVSMWVKPDNFSAQRCMIAKTSQDANVYGWSIQHSSSAHPYVQMRSTGSLPSPHTFTDLTMTTGWQHLVMTYAGGSNFNGWNCYLNGTKSAVTPSSNAMSGTMVHTYPLTVGVRGTAFYFSGNLNQISIWNKELSQSEVTSLYNSGTPSDLTQHSAVANLKSWWYLNTADNYPTELDVIDAINGMLTNMTSGSYDHGDVP